MWLKCHHCGHAWDYKGTSMFRITCPGCGYKVYRQNARTLFLKEHEEVDEEIEEIAKTEV